MCESHGVIHNVYYTLYLYIFIKILCSRVKSFFVGIKQRSFFGDLDDKFFSKILCLSIKAKIKKK